MELKAIITAKGHIFDGTAPEIIHKNLLSAMHEATMLLERKVKEKTPQGVYGAKGGLRSTIHGETIEKGTALRGVVGHQSAYGDVIELGRRPGQKMPPEGVLFRWIEEKMGVSGKAARRIEFVIRRKIGKKGFPGVHMFENAFEANWDTLQGIFNRAGFDIAKTLDSGAAP